MGAPSEGARKQLERCPLPAPGGTEDTSVGQRESPQPCLNPAFRPGKPRFPHFAGEFTQKQKFTQIT